MIVGIFGFFILVYLVLIMPTCSTKGKMKDLLKVRYAHRGLFDNEGNAPENSMAAFRKAVEAGYGIETDLQLSSDGIVVLFHDFTLARIARNANGEPVPGKVSDYTFAQLQQFHLCNSDERIPTFQEFLTLVNGSVPLILEYKIENADHELAVCEKGDELLQTYSGLYCIESFHPRGVQWYKIHRPEVIRGQLSDAFIQEEGKWNFVYFACEHLLFNFLTKPDFIAYNVNHPHHLSTWLCRNLFQNTSICWTVKSEAQRIQAETQFDGIIFDHFVPQDGPNRKGIQ